MNPSQPVTPQPFEVQHSDINTLLREAVTVTDRDVFGIKPAAMAAWLSLAHALREMAICHRLPVCASDPDDWSPDAHPAVRADAAEACSWCPVLGPCGRFAAANEERHGVWAGVDRASRAATRKRDAA